MASRRTYWRHASVPVPAWRPVGNGRFVAPISGADGTTVAILSRYHVSAADERVPVVAVEGDVDHDGAPVLRRALLVAINDHPLTYLDLSRVTFFGSLGLHVLVAAHHYAASRRHTLELRGVHGITRQVLAAVGVDSLFVCTS